MNDPRIKRGWGTSMTPAGTGNYRGGTASTTRAGGYRTRKNKVKPKPVRKISSVAELNKIITEYEKKIKGRIARVPGAGSAFRAGFVTSGGAGGGRK
jgi:hypothetical protein|tara:strand:- start:336 stop:626 length:291 start_codon:yes stop_codon:yes gene_type:complete